ncbi:hypothetical protein COCOR_06611 [Corallococcus coralloides DSM 2259]|uniref:Uncharacterized protein n=1 Tax=Corallococcus coralloides (strain ATCC 25202 / DSM 2259 / NBRC 100086 / M2) TaxID=1144275 RepID=H8MW66_CORCM|nr:hypothetical protein [Corallococcus coralloides]AFE07012.1 hypothetical protein COCOR_06611 [Corallococcus coralloides DSM 2259]
MKKTQSEVESRVIVGAHGVAAEEDHLVMGKIIGVGVGAMVLFLVGAVWAWRIQVVTMEEAQPNGPPPRPAAVGQYEVGIVNQRLFEQDWRAAEKIGGQHQALKNGWGDQPGVTAHKSLEQAMGQVITTEAQKAREPAPAPTPAPAPESAPHTAPPAPAPKK